MLRHKGIGVMPYLYRAFSAKNYCNKIKAAWSILNILSGKKIIGCSGQLCLFCGCDDGFDRLEAFIGTGLYLDKNDRAVGIDHNKVDFARPAGKIMGEFF